MINRIITGIGNNIDDVIAQGTRVAIRLIKGLADSATDLATAGGDALLHVLRGIRKWVDENAEAVGSEGRRLRLVLPRASPTASWDLI
jgi:hypothetical protein